MIINGNRDLDTAALLQITSQVPISVQNSNGFLFRGSGFYMFMKGQMTSLELLKEKEYFSNNLVLGISP